MGNGVAPVGNHRLFGLAVLAVLAATLVGASLAWGCVPPDTGIPAAGTSPPPPGPGPSSAAGEGTGSGSGSARAPTTSTQAVPSPADPSSGSPANGTTSGAVPATTPSRARGRGTPVTGNVDGRRGARALDRSVSSQFAARVRGRTAGVTRRGTQAVFKGSLAREATAKESRGSAASASSHGAA